jgi:hypothetical protein
MGASGCKALCKYWTMRRDSQEDDYTILPTISDAVLEQVFDKVSQEAS